MGSQQRAHLDVMSARQGIAIRGDSVIAHMCITPQMAS